MWVGLLWPNKSSIVTATNSDLRDMVYLRIDELESIPSFDKIIIFYYLFIPFYFFWEIPSNLISIKPKFTAKG